MMDVQAGLMTGSVRPSRIRLKYHHEPVVKSAVSATHVTAATIAAIVNESPRDAWLGSGLLD